MTTVAITGASGCLGRALIARLAREDAITNIVALDKRAPAFADAKTTFVEADVRDPGIDRALQSCDAVVHLAYIVERGSRDPELVQSVNVGGTQNVCQAAVRAGVKQVVYASSIASYGFHASNAGRELSEDAPCRGNDDFYYARTKAECEAWLDGFEAAHTDVAIARLRPTVFIGPDSHRGFGFIQGRVLPYLSGYDQPVHITHEDDVADAFALALMKRARGAYNVATRDPLPMSQWPHATGKPGLRLPSSLVKVADLAYRAKWSDVDPVWLRAGNAHPIVVSSKKIRRKLKWRPRLDTTGAVLRELAGTPTRTASRGTKMLLGTMATVTRVRGGLPVPPRERQELSQLDGDANLVLTGDHPSEWHLSFRRGNVGVHRGLSRNPASTTIMDEHTLFALLGGDTTMAKAQFTGKIRVRGNGHYHLVLSGFLGALRVRLDPTRQRRLPARAFAKFVLQSGPTKRRA